MKEIKLYCPYCQFQLSKDLDKKFETLSEHVCDPNNEYGRPLRPTWKCYNDDCPCSKEDIFWDESGDLYGWSNINFYNDISTAFPSIARRLDIEIYKKGLKKETRLSPALMLWFLMPVIEYHYKADDYGNVLKKSWSLTWRKKNKLFGKGGYYIGYTFPLHMIIWSLKRKRRLIKNIEHSSEFRVKELKREFEPIASWDKRWWRHFTLFLSKIIFRKYYKMTK